MPREEANTRYRRADAQPLLSMAGLNGKKYLVMDEVLCGKDWEAVMKKEMTNGIFMTLD